MLYSNSNPYRGFGQAAIDASLAFGVTNRDRLVPCRQHLAIIPWQAGARCGLGSDE